MTTKTQRELIAECAEQLSADGHYELSLEIAALKAAQPVQSATGCACKWNGELSESRCELHEAWHVAILEWSDRAKAAEAKLAQPAPAALKAAQPVQPAFDVDVSVRYILRVVRRKCSLSDIDDCRIRDVIRAELLAAVKATS